jgi:hypothetical protein
MRIFLSLGCQYNKNRGCVCVRAGLDAGQCDFALFRQTARRRRRLLSTSGYWCVYMIFCTNTLLCFVRVYHNQQAAFWAALAFTRDLARTLTSERASLPRAVMEIAHQTGRRADSLRTAIAKKKIHSVEWTSQ